MQDYATVSFKMETSSDDLTPRPALKTSSISMPPFLVVATLASGRSITYGVQIRPCESPSSKKKSGWEWEPCAGRLFAICKRPCSALTRIWSGAAAARDAGIAEFLMKH